MTIYALLVGVSNYPAGVSSLPGCANDFAAMQEYLRGYADVNEVELKMTPLLDAKANRKDVIAAFANFDAAGADDVCIFYYTGHGSQIPAPKEFWHQEKDRKCEALVLHDFGKPTGGFLADKEISYLLATHTKDAGQVLVLADSCHSGTISRMATATPRTTVFNGLPVKYTDFHGHEHYRKEGEYRNAPVREHITLSACRPEQVAMEMPIKGVRRGLFTNYLVEVMNTTDLSELTYAELADRVRVRVKNRYRKQDVFAQATPGMSMDTLFLEGSLKKNRSHLLHYGEGVGWYFDQGELAGFQEGDTGSARVGEDEKEFSVRRVDAGRSFVTAAAWMDQDAAPYPIVEVEKKGNPMAVFVDAKKLSIYAGALKEHIRKEKATLRIVDEREDARYVVTHLEGYGVSMVLPGEERPLFASVKATDKNWQADFVEKLSKVATYEATLALAPTTRSLDVDKMLDIQLEQVFTDDFGDIVKTETKATDGSAVFAYYEEEATQEIVPPKVRLKVRVKNDFTGSLHVGMLFMDESFGITDQAMPVAKLRSGEEFYQTQITATDDEGEYSLSYFNLTLSDTLQTWGLTEIVNYLKIIVSETPINLEGYNQESIAQQEKIADGKGMRGMTPSRPRRAKRRDRWGVKNIPITIYRPLFANSPTAMAASGDTGPIKITNHHGFSFGGVLLDASLSITRSLTDGAAPPCPTQGYFLEPMSLMDSRSMAAGETPLDMVQLTGVSNTEAVTADAPLEIDAGTAAVEGSIIFAFDEETRRYYPVGFPDKDSGRMIVQQLPNATPEEYTRSLGGSVKLFFRKVVGGVVPWLDDKVNKLRVATVTEELAVEYTEDQSKRVAQAVKDTDRPIALFIHGIIGDTTTAAAILRRAKMPDGSSLYDQYGLVLTYDYENLNTPIFKTSGLFKEDLEAVGLGAGHGKTLHVYAHSMGGLVTRGMIELLGGNDIVTAHLQFGTPNGGSPYGNVAEWLTPLMSRALGAGAAASPYLRWLLGLRWFINKALVTLQEMKTGSDFIKMLNKDGDRRGVPYYLVNGDISLIPDVTTEDLRFFERIMARFDWQEKAKQAFFRSPTDVAVSLESQQSVKELDFYPKAVGCDHMSYFVTPAAIEVLEAQLGQLFPAQ